MDKLVETAIYARKKAYAPYSKFMVGAAVQGKSGRIYGGCNIENASYGLSICAERTAIFKAVSEGEQEFVAIAIAADTPGPVSPCGACRQVIAEFGIEKILLANLRGEQRQVTIEELLPFGFTKGDFRC
ncbi:cytidine deaminase [Sporomusa acidovorans]|uniref:Cytidine deaminase n=1 Tax=Sporomusa acidovorans (strain ATCC 49682 / DSM 3132 / Mol) TaxID=1123286 RepID=A0ABZ3J4F3_SPOA4|nr:cytidine deaminase [Sporomusa acidovorans]OZC23130.1 cytidine deaminase [Sporomusa acidovorans DSM 3132]SDF06269.1 cytidine deaminase [Sporomusa acidovorans]